MPIDRTVIIENYLDRCNFKQFLILSRIESAHWCLIPLDNCNIIRLFIKISNLHSDIGDFFFIAFVSLRFELRDGFVYHLVNPCPCKLGEGFFCQVPEVRRCAF